MRRLCTICARGGSKGVMDKNLRPLAGKPLIAHSIEQALDSGIFAAVAVSSDSQAILEAGRRWGAGHLIERPAELATDDAPKVPVIRHCTGAVEEETGVRFEVVVDLDATSPLRSLDDIRGAVALLEDGGGANVVSGAAARRSPYFNLVEVDGEGRVRLSKEPSSAIARRQDSPPCYDLNASVFVWTRDALLADNDYALGEDTRLFVMPGERSIDIDTETDFRLVEFLFTQREAGT